MKKKRGIIFSHIIAAVLCTLALAGCSRDRFGVGSAEMLFSARVPSFSDWNATRNCLAGPDGIVELVDSADMTKGTPISSVSSFKALGYIYSSWDGTQLPNYFHDETVNVVGGTGTPAGGYDWPGGHSRTVRFYAYWPDGLTVSSSSTAGIPYITYTVPSSASSQSDILVAASGEYTGDHNAAAALQFNHACAAVQVRTCADGVEGTISSVALRHIANSGTCALDGTWSGVTGDADFVESVSLSKSASSAQDVLTGSDTWMMIPQTLGDDAAFEVVFDTGDGTGSRTAVCSLRGKTWTAGTKYVYSFSLDRYSASYSYEVTVSPSSRTIYIGDGTSFTATYNTYRNGVLFSSQDVTSTAAWSSSNTSVASVTAGNVTGASDGTATISATYGGETGSATVTVAIDYLRYDNNTSSNQYFGINNNEQAGSVPVIYYSLNDGATWQQMSRASGIYVDPGQHMLLKGNNPSSFSYEDLYCTFYNVQGNFSGNVMTLVDGTGATRTIPSDYYFKSLFMASRCTFNGLKLPATTLKKGCYVSMFASCSNIVAVPELPATTLAEECYRYMFSYCSSITSSPDLPALTLVRKCYEGMFFYAFSLNRIKIMATNISASNCLNNFTMSVASSGTFIINSAESCGMGSYAPYGWTVQRVSQ